MFIFILCIYLLTRQWYWAIPFRMEQKGNTITVDEIISLTEAAELLGLNSFRQVKTMIKNGHLKAYNKKWSKVKHVLKTDVIALREVEEA